MDNMRCSGDESYFTDCEFNGWGTHNCAHSEDVGIVCQGEGSSSTPVSYGYDVNAYYVFWYTGLGPNDGVQIS